RTPGDVVDQKLVKRFQERAVLPAFVAPARAHGPEHLNHPLPVLVRHPRQHDRLLKPTRQESENQDAGNLLRNLLVSIRPHGLILWDVQSRDTTEKAAPGIPSSGGTRPLLIGLAVLTLLG